MVKHELTPAEALGFNDQEIRIGAWAPLSGRAAPWGAAARGMELYFYLINRQESFGGRQIRLVMFDDRSDPALAAAGVRKLVEEIGIFAFLGGVGDDGCLNVLDYLSGRGLPWVGPLAGAPRFYDPPRKSVFCLRPSYEDEASLLVNYAAGVMKLGRLAVVYSRGRVRRIRAGRGRPGLGPGQAQTGG